MAWRLTIPGMFRQAPGLDWRSGEGTRVRWEPGSWAEHLAWEACCESGLDDRPRCDPAVLARCYLGLRLCPRPGAEARLIGDRLIYPADLDAQRTAYLIGHEAGHEIAMAADCDPAIEERVASRIGVAIMLPAPPYRRDVAVVGWDLDLLCAMWPLASEWVHIRRMAEVSHEGAVATRWTREGCVDRLVTDSIAAPSTVTPLEKALARAALAGSRIEIGQRIRAWPSEHGAAVLCGVDDLHFRVARTGRRELARLG